MLTVRLPADLDKRLAAAARRLGRTKTSLARDAIIEQIDDLEARYLSDKTVDGSTAGSDADVL